MVRPTRSDQTLVLHATVLLKEKVLYFQLIITVKSNIDTCKNSILKINLNDIKNTEDNFMQWLLLLTSIEQQVCVHKFLITQTFSPHVLQKVFAPASRIM